MFVAAGGNSNSDATFNEFIPSSIQLPNLITAGAVDKAGDEAPFTSYGPTVVAHSNGYQKGNGCRRAPMRVSSGMRFQGENPSMAGRPAAVPPSTMAEAFGLKVRNRDRHLASKPGRVAMVAVSTI
jgi:hypothetical protein